MVCIADYLQIKEMEMFTSTFSLVLAARSMDFVVAAGLLKISRGPEYWRDSAAFSPSVKP